MGRQARAWDSPSPKKETIEKVLKFYDSKEYALAPPVDDDVVRCCEELKEMGFKLVIVTARSDEHRKITERALEKYFPGW